MAELVRRHDTDIDELKRRNAAELETLNDRVRRTIEKRDETINGLREQLRVAEAGMPTHY